MIENPPVRVPIDDTVPGETVPENGHFIILLNKLLHDRYFWYSIFLALCMFLCLYAPNIAILNRFSTLKSGEPAVCVALYRTTFILSIAVAAWRFGKTGGIIACFILTPVLFSPFVLGLRTMNIFLEIGVISFGMVISVIMGAQGDLYKLLLRTSAELQQKNMQLELEVVERKRAETEFRTLSLGAIESLVFALEAKDRYTAGHSRRVTEIATAIGKAMNLSSADMEDLRSGSLLHDIGKIAVSEAIQNKPGALTYREYQHIMTHVQAGADIVKPIVNERVVELIKHHHDRFGGNQNQTVFAKNIPLGARIIAVADSFDAMTSDRPYRPAIEPLKALEEIKRCSHSQFDPEVVDAFTWLYQSGNLTIEVLRKTGNPAQINVE